MKIRVILYCIFLCAIILVGCDKQEDEVLVSAAMTTESELCSVGIPINTISTIGECMNDVPFIIGSHSYYTSDLSLNYELSFSILRNLNYKTGSITEEGIELEYYSFEEITWTVVGNSNTVGNDSNTGVSDTTVYHGTDFTHMFNEIRSYEINCQVKLCSSGELVEKSIDFCIDRPYYFNPDYGI